MSEEKPGTVFKTQLDKRGRLYYINESKVMYMVERLDDGPKRNEHTLTVKFMNGHEEKIPMLPPKVSNEKSPS